MSGLRGAVVGGEESVRWTRRALAESYGPADLLLTDSGTSALILAIRAVRSEGRELPIALPGYSCFDLATAAAGADAPVLLYDLDPRTLSPDLQSLEAVLRRGVAAVVVVHLYGVPVDLESVIDIAEAEGVPIIEDAAQGAGGRYRGQRLGSRGSLAVLSFGRGKGTTGAGGGALLANDSRGKRWLQKATRALPERRPRGWKQVPALIGQWMFGRPELYTFPASLPFLSLGETVFREPGPTERLTALSAGTLRETLPAEELHLAVRRRTALGLGELVRSVEDLESVTPPRRSEPGYLRFPVVARERMARRLRSPDFEAVGVLPGYPAPLEALDAMERRCGNLSESRPGTMVLARRLFTLPTHAKVDDGTVDRLRERLRSG